MAQRFSRPTDFVRKRKRDPTVSIVPGTFTDILTREVFLNSFYHPIGASKTEPLVAQYDGPAGMCDWGERALLFWDMSTLRNPTLCDVEATTCAVQRPCE